MKKIIFILSFFSLAIYTPIVAQDWEALNSCCAQDRGGELLVLDSTTLLMTYKQNIYKTVDQGKNWTTVYESDDGLNFIYDISINKEGRIYAVYEKFNNTSGGLLFSDNLGEYWFNLNMQNVGTPHTVHFLNNEVGFIGCADAEIWKTVDGGQSWDKKFSSNYSAFRSIVFLDDQIGFAGGGRVNQTLEYKTTDGGETWTGISFPSVNVNKIQFTSPTVGYACSNYKISKTTNAGQSWIALDTPDAPSGYNTIHFPTDSIGFLATLDYLDGGWDYGSTIYKTEDGGQTWQLQEVDADQLYAIGSIGFYQEYGYMYGAKNGFYFTKIDPILETTTSTSTFPTPLEDLRITPNPADEQIYVGELRDFHYQIFNTSGQIMRQGKAQSAIAIHNLPSGSYYIKINKDGKNQSLPFVKMK